MPVPQPADRNLPLILLAGPTAVGKSEVALLVAEKIGAEIVSVDSMQVYRGLDIGTAKPSPAERARVPHHLIDICDLTENFDAAQFVRRAQKAVAEIQARNHVPIFCCGTGLYFKAYLSGLGEAPATNPELRAELEAASFEALLHELRERDPAAYAQIDKQNPRRVIRAVEVIRLTGKKFSEQRAEWKVQGAVPIRANFYCHTRPPTDLHARINARVDAMFARGLVNETRACEIRIGADRLMVLPEKIAFAACSRPSSRNAVTSDSSVRIVRMRLRHSIAHTSGKVFMSSRA